jgi:glyceraldehyde-3-phosphate dehydrogenase (NADP+)
MGSLALVPTAWSGNTAGMAKVATLAEFPFWLAGMAGRTSTALEVKSPYDAASVGRTWLAGEAEFEQATKAAVAASTSMRNLPAFERAAILMRVCATLKERREQFARVLASEAGKPIRDALTEVDRASMTFHVAAEEARRIGGEMIPLDLAPHGQGRLAITKRFPIGPVAAISPFNFPLNLTSHKIAPAIAAGNPIVLKPATRTPLSAVMLGEAVQQAGLPQGALSVLPMGREVGDKLVTDDRYKLLTFTGSSAVGWSMKKRSGKKKIILELGGNAGVIVDDSADLEFAVQRIAAGGFSYAGQSCISVQRVFVHDRVYDDFAARLVARVESLKVGDPLDPETDVGPMIEEKEVDRVETWVKEALKGKARALTGAKRLGPTIYAPTVLADVASTAKVCAQEAFAPLVGLFRFKEFDKAVASVSHSNYGLQAGVFTRDLPHMLRAFDGLEVGGVIVNDVPTWRIDHMPYGGVKDSGLGREGPRYTIEEMTELKLLVINQPAG